MCCGKHPKIGTSVAESFKSYAMGLNYGLTAQKQDVLDRSGVHKRHKQDHCPIMSSQSSHPQLYENVPSDQRINACIRQGFQDMLVQTSAGLVVGGLAGLILAKRGTGYRKLYTSLGGGVGLGSAWTRTSMNLEQMISPYITISKAEDETTKTVAETSS
jgi:Domain of unknown function (DUF543)